jgi:phage/plasmid-like protein (TIGR03299 family)
MVANIKEQDGVEFAAYARQPAWHRLGHVKADGQMTVEEALELANLANWDVQKEPIYTKDGLVVPGRNATVANILGKRVVLGDVGDRYVVFQTEEHAVFLNTLVHEAGAHVETAGALGRGEKVFISLRLPESVTIGGQSGDKVDTYLGALNAFDASQPFTVVTTPIRWECQNMINYSLSRATNRHTIRHTGAGLKGAVAEAHRVLGLIHEYNHAFEAEAEKLVQVSMTSGTFEEMIAAAYGYDGENLAAAERADERIGQMMTLFDTAGTNDNIRETAWAGFNAIVEYFDWFSATTAEDEDAKRAEKSIAGTWATDAFSTVSKFIAA